MAKSTVTTPTPPPVQPKLWPNPQMTLPRPPPNQPFVNGTPQVMKLPAGGGGNP